MNKNKLTAALKKKALGAAIAVAVSTPAFADVTMFGIVDIGIGMDSSDNDVLRVDGGEGRTIELPSIWGIKGSEDLGGGLTASLHLSLIWKLLQVVRTEADLHSQITGHVFGLDRLIFLCPTTWVV